MTKQQVQNIAGNSINFLGTMASQIYAPASDSNTGVGGAVSGALSGAAAGASLGSVIPGIGTAIGAGVGAIGGFLTNALKKGNVTTNGFYGDPTMQKGGIFSNNSELRKRYNWAQDVVQANRAGLVSSELAENNWLKDHDSEVLAAANGGVAGSLVYGNDGELVKLPNGEMKQFAELGLPTDSQLAFLPNNTKILNKKDSEQITNRMNKSKNTDKYAKGTDAANKLIASIQFDKAFEKQEIEKAKKGIKPKTKQLIPAADKGMKTGTVIIPKYPDRLKASNSEMADLWNGFQSVMPNTIQVLKQDSPKSRSSIDFSSILSSAGSLAPIMSNLFASDPEPVAANFNPYESTVLNAMRRRRYNAEPLLDDVRRNRAITNYNMRNMNTNTGANMAYSLQNAVNTNRAIQSIRNQEQNINSQYLADYANVANSLGQQRVAAMNLADDYNAQNRATTRNIRRAGLSQLSQWTQNNELMRNAKERDLQLFPLYRKFLEAGFTNDDLAALTTANMKYLS